MMTVGELKAALEDYDEDLPICIGMIQTYGSNFATELDDVDELTVDDWEYGEEKKVVNLLMNKGNEIDNKIINTISEVLRLGYETDRGKECVKDLRDSIEYTLDEIERILNR